MPHKYPFSFVRSIDMLLFKSFVFNLIYFFGNLLHMFRIAAFRPHRLPIRKLSCPRCPPPTSEIPTGAVLYGAGFVATWCILSDENGQQYVRYKQRDDEEMSTEEWWMAYTIGFLASDLPGRNRLGDKLFCGMLSPLFLACVVLSPKGY